MTITKKILALCLVCCLAFSMVGCSSIKNALSNVLGVEEEEQTDPLTRATPANSSIALPEGVSSTSQFETTFFDEEGVMYLVFNGIASRDTQYFYAPSGTLTLSSRATGESTGMKSFKIAVWEKLAGATQYVPDTTIYFYTNDETNTYTITGLDPTKEYRINVSYDAYGYYIYGTMKVEGAMSTLPTPETEEGAEEGEGA